MAGYNYAMLFVCLYLLKEKGHAVEDFSMCGSKSNETRCHVCQGNTTCSQSCPDGYYNVYVPGITCHNTTLGPENTSIEHLSYQGMSTPTTISTALKASNNDEIGQGTMCVKCDPTKLLNENTTLYTTCSIACLTSNGNSDGYFAICKKTYFGNVCVQICPLQSQMDSVIVLLDANSSNCESASVTDKTNFKDIVIGVGRSVLALVFSLVAIHLLYHQRRKLTKPLCAIRLLELGAPSNIPLDTYNLIAEDSVVSTPTSQDERRYANVSNVKELVTRGGAVRQDEYLSVLSTTTSSTTDDQIGNNTAWALSTENYEVAWLLLQDISRRLKNEEGDTCIEVYPAYEKGYRWKPIFVIVSNQDDQNEREMFMGYPVYRRRFGSVSPEAKEVIHSTLVQNNFLSPEDIRVLKQAIHSACLHEKHRSITLISACPFRSKKGGTALEKELCIVVYCFIKGLIPFNEEPFPDEVKGIPVDVREGYYQQCGVTPPGTRKMDIEYAPDPNQGQRSRDNNSSLLMGTCIGPTARDGSGTLGGFVILQDGSIGGLTCAHVTQDSKFISQPACAVLCYKSSHKRCVFGNICETMVYPGSVDKTGIDAAIIKITDRKPVNGEFVLAERQQIKFAGFDPSSPPTFSKGKILSLQDLTSNYRHTSIIKSGAETGLTCGKLYLDGLYVRMSNREMRLPNSNQTVEFFNQMEVTSVLGPSTPFFSLGDSGSLAFMPLKDSELQCIGLCVGCTSYGSCVVTPIEEVFNKSATAVRFVDFSSAHS